jgi:hypothetical protein
MAINTSNIKLQITRGNNMARRKTPTIEIKNPDTKDLPRETFEYLYPEQETIRVPTRRTLPKKGKKRKGLDPRTLKNRKLIMQKKLKGKQKILDKAPPYGKITGDDFKKLKKRKGGGMTYQLYGGSTKDFSDGNKFIQSFYDKE